MWHFSPPALNSPKCDSLCNQYNACTARTSPGQPHQAMCSLSNSSFKGPTDTSTERRRYWDVHVEGRRGSSEGATNFVCIKQNKIQNLHYKALVALSRLILRCNIWCFVAHIYKGTNTTALHKKLLGQQQHLMLQCYWINKKLTFVRIKQPCRRQWTQLCFL